MTLPRAAFEERTAVRRTHRRLPSARRWHFWINLVMGAVLALWTVSGVVMLLPASKAARTGQGTGRPIDWSTVAVAPDRAVRAAVAGSPGETPAGISLQRLRDGMVYLVRFERRTPVLVDAATGDVVTIDATLAAAIAADALPGAAAARVARVEQASASFGGPYPAFHVVFDDDAATEAWVAEATGEVRRSVRRDRIRSSLGGKAHLFAPLRQLPGGDTTRKAVLAIASAVAMLSILTGYWLALPRRWRD